MIFWKHDKKNIVGDLFLPLLVLTQGAAPVKSNTGCIFPRKYQRLPRNDYQYLC